MAIRAPDGANNWQLSCTANMGERVVTGEDSMEVELGCV